MPAACVYIVYTLFNTVHCGRKSFVATHILTKQFPNTISSLKVLVGYKPSRLNEDIFRLF